MRVYIFKIFKDGEVINIKADSSRDAKYHLMNFLTGDKCVVYNPSGYPISACNRKDGYYFYTPAALEKPLENI